MRKILSLLALLSILPYGQTLAAEVDSYRNVLNISNSSSFLNNRVNTWLRSTVLELNDYELPCPVDTESADEVYDILKSKISKPFIGHAVAVDLDESLENRFIVRTDFDYSVYSEVTWLEGVSLNLKGLLGLMNINGRRVGVDKIGHFFVEGFGFFRRAYIKDEGSIESAIRWGKFTENSYFGLTTTGVYSNADLVANFNGMRFWNMLFLFSEDPVSERGSSKYGKVPFLTCEDSKWKLNKRFFISKFVDDSWDESLNCNSYDSDGIRERVVRSQALNIGHHSLQKNEGLVCPRVSRSCLNEKFKYGRYAQDLLHASCFDKSKEYRVDPELFKLRGLSLIRQDIVGFDYFHYNFSKQIELYTLENNLD